MFPVFIAICMVPVMVMAGEVALIAVISPFALLFTLFFQIDVIDRNRANVIRLGDETKRVLMTV